jgi:hypothetical protein
MAPGGLPVVDEQQERAESGGAPEVDLQHLDTLWFQVTGNICNLE